MKLVQACLSARKDGECSFHHCVGLVSHLNILARVTQQPHSDENFFLAISWH